MDTDIYPFLLTELLTNAHVDFTYIGIGSCPHFKELNQYTPSWQQLFPPFLQELSTRTPQRIRCLHIDPAFSNQKPLLEAYFQTLGMVALERKPYDPDCLWRVGTEQIEVLLVSARFEHADHEWFLEDFIEGTLAQSRTEKILLQEFTGYSLNTIRNRLFSGTNFKLQFLSRVLLDFTYGLEEGCYQDLTKYKPFLKESGEFLNILLESDESLMQYLGRFPFVDTFIQRRYYALYIAALNTIHVDYRRATLGQPFERSSEYSETATPDEIMGVLQRTIHHLTPYLLRTRLMSVEQRNELERLFNSYKTMDMYKWNQQVRNLVKFEPRSQATVT